MQTKPTDAEIMKNVIEALDTNPTKLSKVLGYKSQSTFHNIIHSRANITLQIADNIVEHYPQVNYLYLTRGELPILKENNQNQNNMFHKESPGDLFSMMQIPDLLKENNDLLRELIEVIKNNNK